MAISNADTATVMLVQSILQRSNPKLLIDGKFGHFTQGVYESSPQSIKDDVAAALKVLGVNISDLRAKFRTLQTSASEAQRSGDGNWISQVSAQALVRRYAAAMGQESIAPHILGFMDLEARKKTVNGEVFYDAQSASPNGRYLGLFQMGRDAWSDAARFITAGGFGFTLESFNEGVYKPDQNIAAGVAYAIINAKALKARKIPVTANTLYGAHNQGVGGFAQYVAKNELLAPQQSTSALRVLASARQETLSA